MSKLTKEEQDQLKALQEKASAPAPKTRKDELHDAYVKHPSDFAVDLAHRLEQLEAAAKKSSKVK